VRDLSRPLGVIDATGNGGNLVTPFLYTNVIGPQAGQRCDRPIGVSTSVHNKFQLIAPYLAQKGNTNGHGGYVRSLHQPLGTIVSKQFDLLVAPLAVKFYKSGIVKRIDGPLDSITSRDRFGLASAYLTKLRGSGGWSSIAKPIDTICAGAATFGLTSAYLLANNTNNWCTAITDPIGAITTANRHYLMSAFVTHLRGTHGRGIGGSGLSLRDLVPTITSGGGHLYCTSAALTPVEVGSDSSSDGAHHYAGGNSFGHDFSPYAAIWVPRPVEYSVASYYLYLGATACIPAENHQCIYTPRELLGPSENPAINRGFWRVYDLMRRFLGDKAPLPIVRKDGCEYLIYDIGMRMLTPRELLNAQFGPELAKDYVLTGTRESQVAKIGNSVPPLLGAAVVAANWNSEDESGVAA
jgi:DNA (cytosine-5)-methyltransferase 1